MENQSRVRILSEGEAAYIAGIIDGEGTITVTSTNRKDQKRPYYKMCVTICNTNMEMLHKVSETLGCGNISYRDRENPNWKNVGQLSFSQSDSVSILQQIYKFLIIKKQQAEYGLKFLSLKTKQTEESVDTFQEQALLCELIQGLNKRGREAQKSYYIIREDKEVTKCSYENCSEIHYGNGYCRKHYRWIFESKSFSEGMERKCLNCSNDLPTNARIDSKFCCKSCKMKYHRREGCYTPENKVFDAPKCSKEDCDKFAHGRGLCRAHYMRARRLNELPTVSQSVIMS